MREELRRQLRGDEGEVLHAYPDSLGYLTIGVGRLIDKRKGGGISPEESAFLLDNDLMEIVKDVTTHLPWAALQLSEARLAVLCNMCFQLGIENLLGFHNTLDAIKAGDYDHAADMMLESKWATQTPNRAKRLSEQMRTGEWVYAE